LYHLGYKPDVETYAMFYAADTDGDGDVSERLEGVYPFCVWRRAGLNGC